MKLINVCNLYIFSLFNIVLFACCSSSKGPEEKNLKPEDGAKYITKALQIDEKAIFYTNSIVGNFCRKLDIEVKKEIDDYFKKTGQHPIYIRLSIGTLSNPSKFEFEDGNCINFVFLIDKSAKINVNSKFLKLLSDEESRKLKKGQRLAFVHIPKFKDNNYVEDLNNFYVCI